MKNLISFQIVSGLPVRNGIKHAATIASLALVLRMEVAGLKFSGLSFECKTKVRLRVGIHSGKQQEHDSHDRKHRRCPVAAGTYRHWYLACHVEESAKSWSGPMMKADQFGGQPIIISVARRSPTGSTLMGRQPSKCIL